MNLKRFSWCCLLLGVLPLIYWAVMGLGESMETAILFSTAMITMAVGFHLVGRELAKVASAGGPGSDSV